MDWIEIFRAGRHTDSAGQTRDWTAADLATIARQYDPAHHEAPIVLGHPAHDAPAYGWIEALKVEGDRLLAKPRQLAAEFVQWVRDGKYKKVSIALYPDLTLRHLGFLGAMPPAVKGLAPAAFADAGRPWVAMEGWQQTTAQGMFRRLREWLIATAGLATADQVLPGFDIDALAPREDEASAVATPGYSDTRAMVPRAPAVAGGGAGMKDWLEKMRAGLLALFAEAEQSLPANGQPAGTPGATPGPALFTEADVAARERAAASKATAAAEAKAAEAQARLERERRVHDVRTRVAQFVEAGVAAGTFLPAWRALGVPAVLEQALLVETPLEYAEGQEAKNPGEILLAFLQGLPKVVPLGEAAKPTPADTAAGDTAAAKLDALTWQVARERSLPYGHAFLEAQRAHPELAAAYAAEMTRS